MSLRAAVFDVGGVLERVGPAAWMERWHVRLGMTRDAFDAAESQVDPEGLAVVGGMSEQQLRSSYATVFGLSPAEAEELMTDVWDWCCGTLDEPLVNYLRALRPRLRTGIISNSADGARREDGHRYRLPELVDDVIYSHEVGITKPDPAIFRLACRRLAVAPSEAVFVDDLPENVAAATRLGMYAVLHKDTARTISAINALLDAPH
jgi:epoxide hydrolase-like predicted phosphatase